MTKNSNNQKSFFQKNRSYIISAVVVLIVALFFSFIFNNKSTKEIDTNAQLVENTEEVVVEAVEVSIPQGEEAYNSAIASHEGRVVEVTDVCVATPETLSIALGETAVLNNSSDLSQDFTMGEETFTVGARHYKTLRFKEAQVATLTCGDVTISTIEVK